MSLRLLRGRVAVREILPASGRIIFPDDYHDKHVRDTKSHRGLVLAMGAPALTLGGAEVTPGFRVGDVVHFVFALQGCEKSRVNTWPIDGRPCVWVAQEEVMAVEGEARCPGRCKGDHLAVVAHLCPYQCEINGTEYECECCEDCERECADDI